MKVNSVSNNAVTAYRQGQQAAKSTVNRPEFSEVTGLKPSEKTAGASAKSTEVQRTRAGRESEKPGLLQSLSAEERAFIDRIFSEDVTGGYTRGQKKELPPQKGLNIDLFA